MSNHQSILYAEWQRSLHSNEQRPLSHYRLAAQAIRQGLGTERKIWIAGAIHPRETRPLLETYIQLKSWQPNLLLIINPQDCSACGEIYSHCRYAGLTVSRHSDGLGCLPLSDVYLLDTSEELGLFYLASDAAFIGTSLIPDGYPDPSPAARAGLPLVAGPYIGQQHLDARLVKLSARLERVGSLRRASAPAQLSNALQGLLADGQLGKALGECARRIACRARSSRYSGNSAPNQLPQGEHAPPNNLQWRSPVASCAI